MGPSFLDGKPFALGTSNKVLEAGVMTVDKEITDILSPDVDRG